MDDVFASDSHSVSSSIVDVVEDDGSLEEDDEDLVHVDVVGDDPPELIEAKQKVLATTAKESSDNALEADGIVNSVNVVCPSGAKEECATEATMGWKKTSIVFAASIICLAMSTASAILGAYIGISVYRNVNLQQPVDMTETNVKNLKRKNKKMASQLEVLQTEIDDLTKQQSRLYDSLQKDMEELVARRVDQQMGLSESSTFAQQRRETKEASIPIVNHNSRIKSMHDLIDNLIRIIDDVGLKEEFLQRMTIASTASQLAEMQDQIDYLTLRVLLRSNQNTVEDAHSSSMTTKPATTKGSSSTKNDNQGLKPNNKEKFGGGSCNSDSKKKKKIKGKNQKQSGGSDPKKAVNGSIVIKNVIEEAGVKEKIVKKKKVNNVNSKKKKNDKVRLDRSGHGKNTNAKKIGRLVGV